jgi:hypothetical protein
MGEDIFWFLDDYVQAGEKIWGALSALINSRVFVEIKGVNEKESSFLRLFSAYRSRTTTNVSSQMRGLGFRTDKEIFDSIYGLHKFFYGGSNYTNSVLSQIIPFLISLIEQL